MPPEQCFEKAVKRSAEEQAEMDRLDDKSLSFNSCVLASRIALIEDKQMRRRSCQAMRRGKGDGRSAVAKVHGGAPVGLRFVLQKARDYDQP